nr:MAG TPA: hypothetical protein [Caudoviricetes sp.]
MPRKDIADITDVFINEIAYSRYTSTMVKFGLKE